MNIALKPPPRAIASPISTSCSKFAAGASDVGEAALVPEGCPFDRAVLLTEGTNRLIIVDVPVLWPLPRAVGGGFVEAAFDPWANKDVVALPGMSRDHYTVRRHSTWKRPKVPHFRCTMSHFWSYKTTQAG